MNYNDITTQCFEEMFERVGLSYPDKELTDQPDWWTKHPWTEAEDEDFRKWMYKFVKAKTRLSKKVVETEVAMFNLMWGWSIKEGANEIKV